MAAEPIALRMARNCVDTGTPLPAEYVKILVGYISELEDTVEDLTDPWPHPEVL